MKQRDWGWYWVRVVGLYQPVIAHWSEKRWTLSPSYGIWPTQPRVLKVLSGKLDYQQRPEPRKGYFKGD